MEDRFVGKEGMARFRELESASLVDRLVARVAMNGGSMTQRDLMRSMRRPLDKLSGSLRILVDSGRLVKKRDGTKRHGRKSIIYYLPGEK